MIRKLLVGLVILTFMFVPGVATAHNGVVHSTEREARQHESRDSQTQPDEAKRQACEVRAETISSIMTRSVRRAENYGALLTTITERLEVFVGNLGEQSTHYNFAPVNAAQANFESNLVALKAEAMFDCNTTDPKSQITAFRQANQAVMKDLQEWRTALKAIVAQLRESGVQR